MESAMRSMNMEQISNLMDRFEQQFESLDVQTSVMSDAMQSTTTMTTPQNQVDSLMQEVADEAGIELNQVIFLYIYFYKKKTKVRVLFFLLEFTNSTSWYNRSCDCITRSRRINTKTSQVKTNLKIYKYYNFLCFITFSSKQMLIN
jgi:hypothetical protein